MFTAVLAVSAYISVPLGSVPLTLQVFGVLLAGMVLGPRLGLLSVLAYLVLGLIAPVYSGGASGLAVLFGPTGGYLIGFVPAVLLTGWLAGQRRTSVPWLMLAGVAGLAPLYALGAVWLAVQLGLGPSAAIAAGVAPFLWVDVLKALAAALAARALVSLPLDLPAEMTRGR